MRTPDSGTTAVEVTVDMVPKSHGEQAGLFWYADDDHWVKIVVEGMKDGSAMVVMGREYGDDTDVVKKIPIEGAAKLRLELSPDRKQITGMVDLGHCMRLVGQCDFQPIDARGEVMVGVGAHGAEEGQAQDAAFTDFRLLRIESNRIQFGMEPPTSDPSVSVVPTSEDPAAAAAEVDMSGWTFSSSLSAEQLASIKTML
jgi:regulation of enolase protein 1 (concanavalin A-like superfamily)